MLKPEVGVVLLEGSIFLTSERKISSRIPIISTGAISQQSVGSELDLDRVSSFVSEAWKRISQLRRVHQILRLHSNSSSGNAVGISRSR